MTTTATVARDGRALTWARSGRLSSVRTPGGHRRYSRAEVLARLAASEQRRTT